MLLEKHYLHKFGHCSLFCAINFASLNVFLFAPESFLVCRSISNSFFYFSFSSPKFQVGLLSVSRQRLELIHPSTMRSSLYNYGV